MDGYFDEFDPDLFDRSEIDEIEALLQEELTDDD